MENDLIITIDAKADKAKEALADLIKETEGLGESMQATALLGVAVFAALVAGIGLSIEAFAEQERAVRSLNLSLQNQGIYTAELSEEYKATAEAIERKTGADADQIIQGQALMQSLIGQKKITPELTQAIVDLATATGTDLHTAFMAASRAVESGILAIGRYHMQLDPTLTQSQRLAAVQELLGQKFGGAAEEAAQGLGGWVLVKAEFRSLERQVGEDFAPAFVQAMKLVKESLSFMAPIAKEISTVWGNVFPTLYHLFSSFVYMTIQTADGLATALNGLLHLDSAKIKQGWATVMNVIEDGAKEFVDLQEETRQNEVKKEIVQSETKKTLAKKTNNELDELDRLRSQAAVLKQEVELLEITEHGSKLLELKKRQLADLEKASKDHDKKTREALKLDAQAQIDQQNQLGKTLLVVDSQFHTQKVQAFQSGLSELAGMQQSHNATLKAIGKAAAIADIIINTESAAMKIISGFSAIPIVGYSLGLALAGAMVAYSGERIAGVVAAADGGLITGGIPGRDSVPAMLMPGELVVPRQNFQDVVNAYAGKGGGEGGGYASVELTLKGELAQVVEAEILQRQHLNISLLRST